MYVSRRALAPLTSRECEPIRTLTPAGSPNSFQLRHKGLTVMRFLQILFVLFVSMSLVGCGPSEPTAEILKTVPASGILTYQGKPLANHDVTFFPTDGRRPASSRTDDHGKFTLGTNGPDDGAVTGTHKVAITGPGPTFVGEPGKEDPSNIQLPKATIPDKFSNPETSGLTQAIPESGAADIKIELP